MTLPQCRESEVQVDACLRSDTYNSNYHEQRDMDQQPSWHQLPLADRLKDNHHIGGQ